MGATEIPSQSAEIYKVPTGTYEFGANYIDPKVSTTDTVYRQYVYATIGSDFCIAA